MLTRIFTALVSFLLVLLCNGAPASAGPEFPVSERRNAQHSPSGVILANGNVLVCWTHTNANGTTDVRCQQVGPAGNPVGKEFNVEPDPDGNQDSPSVTALDDGGFIVTWASFEEQGPGWSIVARRFDADGDGDDPFIVEEKSDDHHINPSVTQLKNGGYVITWVFLNKDTAQQNVFAKIYDKNDRVVLNEFLVNKPTNGDNTDPVVTALPSGNFAVAWASFSPDGSDSEVMVQIFNPKGQRVGKQFRVNTETDNYQRLPTMVAVVDKLIVAWQSLAQDGSLGGIFGRVLSLNGRAVNREFRINTHTANWQEFPSVAAVQNGFVVAWESEGQDGSGRGIFARVYNHSGKPVTNEFRVNTTRQGAQVSASVAASADDRNFTVFWSGGEFPNMDIFGRRFVAPPIPSP